MLINISNPGADFHCAPFSQALIAALQLNKSGCCDLLGMPCTNPKAASHYMPFSNALIAALQLITSG